MSTKESLKAFKKTEKWRFHNPNTGYMEFLPNTPQNIIELHKEYMGQYNPVIELALKTLFGH